jgi:hypothetical protein
MLVDEARGVFADVGYDDDRASVDRLSAHEKATARVIDLAERNPDAVVLPGLMDAHIHVGYMGEAQEYAQLQDFDSPQALVAAVAAHATQHPRKSWLVGVGWDQSAWGRYPTRQDLDAAVPDRPVVLYRACWHIVVANSCALRMAGLALDAAASVRAGMPCSHVIFMRSIRPFSPLQPSTGTGEGGGCRCGRARFAHGHFEGDGRHARHIAHDRDGRGHPGRVLSGRPRPLPPGGHHGGADQRQQGLGALSAAGGGG